MVTEEMKLDVTFSNPCTALLIAKWRIDKMDAAVLANMRREKQPV